MSYLMVPSAAGICRRKQASGLGEACLYAKAWNAQLVLPRAQFAFFKQPHLHKTNETGNHMHIYPGKLQRVGKYAPCTLVQSPNTRYPAAEL